LAFAAHEQLKAVGLFGEVPRILCRLESTGPSGTWNRNGVILFSHRHALFQAPSRGGLATPATFVDTRRDELVHLLPQFLPDGRHFMYVARASPAGSINSWIVLASLNGSEHRRLIHASSQAVYAVPGYVIFVSDG